MFANATGGRCRCIWRQGFLSSSGVDFVERFRADAVSPVLPQLLQTLRDVGSAIDKVVELGSVGFDIVQVP